MLDFESSSSKTWIKVSHLQQFIIFFDDDILQKERNTIFGIKQEQILFSQFINLTNWCQNN